MLPLFPFTENPSSIAMADLIHSSLRENNLKRLFYVPLLVVVDTCGKENIGTEERKDCIERTVKIAIHFGFDVYVTSLETPEYFQKVDNKTQFEFSSPNIECRQRLQSSLSALKDNTAREDMIENLHAQILVKVAAELNCQKIFVPDSATSLAVKLMSGKLKN